MSLKDKRVDRGLTQVEAANLFGIKYRTYQNYENGNTSPDMETAAMFARYFSCTIGDLFDLEEGKKNGLNDLEAELIARYQNMSDQGRAALLAIARDLEELFPME